MWEPADVTKGLIVNGFLLLFVVRVHLLTARNSPFACWCHSFRVKLFSQVRLLHLIFAVPHIQEQIVGAPEAGHAILCRVRVSGRGGAGLAPQQHEASYGFCTLAQRSKKHKHHNESLAPPLLDIREVTKACGESAREHLNGTLFYVTDMEKEEPPKETDFIRHDDDNDGAEDPESTGTAVAEAVVPIVFTPMRGRMCARIVPMLRTCQASRHPSRS